MPDLKKFQPKSRDAWRRWLDRHHATSPGVWLVYAKKHTRIPSLSYSEAVEEALCVGWIDSLMKSIDDRFHMQMFTPRNPRSAWSALNRARVARLSKAGLMTAAGIAAVTLAKKSGRWKANAHVEALIIPPELKKAFEANPDAKKNWPSYSPSAQRSFLHMVNNAKRPETRERYARRVVDLVASGVSMTELRRQAMRGNK